MAKDVREDSVRLHERFQGKLGVHTLVPVTTRDELSLAYTPGVAEPCLRIAADPDLAYDLTLKGRTVAVITDGTAVLGLGDIGPEASLPVMEGKCVLFKEFAGVDAFPLALATKDVDEFVDAVALLAPTFGAINLEDISAPRCFAIERALRERLDIPVFHDDQHGTAIVVFAALHNALKMTGRSLSDVRIVISGAGAAAQAIARMLCEDGSADITLVDSKGAIYEGRENLDEYKADLAKRTNRAKRSESLGDLISGADVFIGVSAPNVLTREMVGAMNADAIVFALANPDPEITPEEARAGGAAVIATGRSDYPNQINNVLAFPGIMKGALSVRASDITPGMKRAAAVAIASLVARPSPEEIIPGPFDRRVADAVAEAVASAARADGVARR